MNSKPGAFQLEKTVPGTFLMQGGLGGVLGGYVAALIGVIVWRETDLVRMLWLLNATVLYGAIIGVIKATVMWGVVRLTGIQHRAITRVATTIILACLIVAALGWQFDLDEDFLPGCLVASLSVGIPVALLVGSRLKPWETFTFGSFVGAPGSISNRLPAIFLVARLSAKTHPAPSLNIVDRKSIEYAKNVDHDCLGSRFADWQERVA